MTTTAWLHDSAERKRAVTRKCQSLALWRDDALRPHWERYKNITTKARQDYDELSGIPVGWDGPVELSGVALRAWNEYQRISASAYAVYRSHEQQIEAEWKRKIAAAERAGGEAR